MALWLWIDTAGYATQSEPVPGNHLRALLLHTRMLTYGKVKLVVRSLISLLLHVYPEREGDGVIFNVCDFISEAVSSLAQT